MLFYFCVIRYFFSVVNWCCCRDCPEDVSISLRNIGNVTDKHVVVSYKIIISALLVVVDSGCSHSL